VALAAASLSPSASPFVDRARVRDGRTSASPAKGRSPRRSALSRASTPRTFSSQVTAAVASKAGDHAGRGDLLDSVRPVHRQHGQHSIKDSRLDVDGTWSGVVTRRDLPDPEPPARHVFPS